MWLESVMVFEAAAAFWLSVLNVGLLTRVARAEARRPRRTAAIVLGCACAGQAMEALGFLWLGGPATAAGGWPVAALLLVRTALLTSTGLLSALLLRASSRGR